MLKARLIKMEKKIRYLLFKGLFVNFYLFDGLVYCDNIETWNWEWITNEFKTGHSVEISKQIYLFWINTDSYVPKVLHSLFHQIDKVINDCFAIRMKHEEMHCPQKSFDGLLVKTYSPICWENFLNVPWQHLSRQILFICNRYKILMKDLSTTLFRFRLYLL